MFQIGIITIAIILILIGIIGTILPYTPSVPIVFGGILFYAVATGFNTIGIPKLSLMLIFTLASLIIGYAMSIYGAKYFGASKYGIWGGIIGIFVGILFAPFGLLSILICPFLGTIIGEIIAGKHFVASSKSGLGTLVGFFIGTLTNILIIAWMVFEFARAIF